MSDDFYSVVQCPLCDTWRVGKWSTSLFGEPVPPACFVARLDLKGHVCIKCDAELGPDTVRLKLADMCRNPEQVRREMLDAYAARMRNGYVDREAW
jgi:hypothetical protein